MISIPVLKKVFHGSGTKVYDDLTCKKVIFNKAHIVSIEPKKLEYVRVGKPDVSVDVYEVTTINGATFYVPSTSKTLIEGLVAP